MQRAFISLYGVTETRFRRVCDLPNEGKSPKDNKGKIVPNSYPKANIVPTKIYRKIHQNILYFPKKRHRISSCRIGCQQKRHSMFKKKYLDLEVNYKF